MPRRGYVNGPTRRFLKAHEDQPAPAPPPGPDDRLSPGNGILCYKDIALVLQLDAAGKTQAEIAAVVGVKQPRISKLLAGLRDSRPLAKQRLYASAEQIAKAAVRASDKGADRGDGSVALELLDRLDVVPKKRDDRDRSTKVMVVVGRADASALPVFPQIEIPHGDSGDSGV